MSSALPSLIGKSAEEIRSIALSMGQSEWRGSQLRHHVYRRAVTEFRRMNDLPESFRLALESKFLINPLTISARQKSRDGTQKLLVHSGDEQNFECVLLPFEKRVSCCISSQIGCPMGCTFCATGLGGFDRNLTATEIVAQYLLLQGFSERRIGHVVFMGMGEPLLNLKNVVEAIHLLTKDVGLSMRNITVSTVGLVPQIRELAQFNLPINLALSLHSPFDDIRSNLMPVNNRWKIAQVIEAMRDYFDITKRRLTIEYLLIDGVNDRPEDAVQLAKIIRGLCTVVNLIPFNYVSTSEGFQRPSDSRIRAFKNQLVKHGVQVTQRTEKGHDISAACGQLAGMHLGKFAKRGKLSDLPVLS